MKTNYISLFTGLFFMVMFFSCDQDEFISVSDPNSIDTKVFWENDPELAARKVVDGIYARLSDGALYGDFYDFFPNVITDQWDTEVYFDWPQFSTLDILSTNQVLRRIWGGFYSMIQRSNDALTNLGEYKESIDPDLYEELMGQAYFFRGFAYFKLLQIFGKYYPERDPQALGVPIYLEVPKSQDEINIARNTVQEVYNRILEDLTRAESVLPGKWDELNVGRVTSYAAKGYLGKLHLWFHEYDKADVKFKEIIDNPDFGLIENYRLNFNSWDENNKESIFEMQVSDLVAVNPQSGGPGTKYNFRHAALGVGGNGNSWVSNNAADSFFVGDYKLTEHSLKTLASKAVRAKVDGRMRFGIIQSEVDKLLPLLNVSYNNLEDLESAVGGLMDPEWFEAFKSDIALLAKVWDPRWHATAYMKGDTFNTGEGWNVYQADVFGNKKYMDEDNSSSQPGTLHIDAGEVNQRLLRLADVYLMYAETQYELGNDEVAFEYINKVRRRGWKFDPEATSEVDYVGNETFMEVLHHERYVELLSEAHYWFDIVRWGMAHEVLAYKGFVHGIHEAMPIPNLDMEINKNLIQNEGYY